MVSETAKTLSLQQKITLSPFHFRYISLKRIPKKQKKKEPLVSLCFPRFPCNIRSITNGVGFNSTLTPQHMVSPHIYGLSLDSTQYLY